MVGTRGGVDPSESASAATYGSSIAISGAVTVGLGLVLATEFPVIAAVLVGVPAGLTAWAVVRETAARTGWWSSSAANRDEADAERKHRLSRRTE